MCGIAGWIDCQRDLSGEGKVVLAMTQTLVHRGADEEGFWQSRHAVFGHRRLSVVDPAGGSQPMVREQGRRRYVIVYNGELYNAAELRDELVCKGYRFRGRSDTEVLLVSYIEWGSECLARLNGIFAFAVWEEPACCLFLARDRLGVKPLFYTQCGSSFLFASEIKALLANPLVRPLLDAQGLAEVFVMGPYRTPGHGVFKGIRELKPGHYLNVDASGCGPEQRYWALESAPHVDDLKKTAETIRYLVQDSVERQLVADVPLAAFLSGGLDSSALTAIAAAAFARLGAGRLHTFSVDYVDNSTFFRKNQFQPDEDSPWVKLVASKVGSNHHYILLDTPQLLGSLKEAVRARDLPGMADIDSSLLLFCRQVKKEATVVLSGECADEIFGGYPWFTDWDVTSGLNFPWIRNVEARMKLLHRWLTAVIRPREYLKARFSEALDEVPYLPREERGEAMARAMFYLNITRFMPALLERKDRMSMAAGLEARVPYCDHRLVEYAWNIPWYMKCYGGMEKGILRLALEGIVPEEVLSRRKSPYPKTCHPAYLEAARRELLGILDDAGAPLNPFLDHEAVRSFVLSKQASASFPWFGQLMGSPQLLAFLIQVNTWLEEYRVVCQF